MTATPTTQPFALVAHKADGRRVELFGANSLRAIAAIAVIYTHIAFFFKDTLDINWWLMDVVEETLVYSGGLNLYLSFFGVAIFMMLTGLLLTGSAIRQHKGKFLANRIGRLLPGAWVATAIAVVLIKAGFMGTFSGQTEISNGEAALSFVLGGFFLKPQPVEVLGVTWTLLVQILFFLLVMSMQGLLRRWPILMPIAGALVSMGILAYNHWVPFEYAVPMLSKLAATLPALFMGQIIYLAGVRASGWVWIVVATVMQVLTVQMATELGVYWAGTRYLWTMVVVTGLVMVVGKYRGRLNDWGPVHWLSSRSFGIYLLHTLMLYSIFNFTEPYLGTTGAVLAFLLVLFVLVEAFYRWIEQPAGRWIGRRTKNIGEKKAAEAKTAATPTL
ncbi:acyltransferase family protein [Tomitella biformata]|uniref:acyltransferase family protein n=1 Tax=Tomitella biformata TaxID=630403 RepID=UPI000A05F3E2|nr:acyltransferase [Tomitella biformata]